MFKISDKISQFNDEFKDTWTYSDPYPVNLQNILKNLLKMLRKVSLQKVLFSTHQNCMNGRSFILFKIFRLLGRNFHQKYFLQGQVRGASSLLFSDGPRGSARPDRLLRAASDTRPASLDRRNLWRTFSTGEFLPFRQLRGKKNIFVSFRNPTR